MDTAYHVLLWGGGYTLVTFILVIATYRIDPKIFGADLGWDKENQNRTGALFIMISILALLILTMVYATNNYEQIRPDLSFGVALLINYLIFQVFNLADLVILD
ncbi:MAG: hypothetical protein AAF806_08480 [Bacteroidota bacterium]